MRRALIVVLSLVLPGCAGLQHAGDTAATVDLRNTSGASVGLHAVHIHAVGKCDPPDFNSAGPHFNPTGKQHGALNPQGSHAGDLPNLNVGADGSGRLETASEQIALASGAASLWDADGSSLVVHAAPDDFKTDPTGNSGARIACGVLTKAPK